MEEVGRLDVEVKTICSEIVKPCDPSPCHLKTMKLSLLDQLFPFYLYPILLFYSAPSSSSSSSPSLSDSDQLMLMMKASLSKALSQFYPLAGRLLDDSTLVCNDQGVALIHTQVTCSLKSYLSLINTSMFYSDDEKLPLGKLLPSQESLHGSHQHHPIPISAWIQLALQLNIFECGGIVIGCYTNHKLLDATSLITFLQHWAGLCLGLGPEHMIQPNFDAALTTFPPYGPMRSLAALSKSSDGEMEELLKPPPTTTTITCKAFVFKATAIISLREMIVSDRIPHPTRVESVLGFLWKHCVAAEGGSSQVRPTTVTLTMNMRPRAQPPFPRESMGNIGTNVVARAENNGFRLVDLVAEIRGAINHFNDEKMREFQGDKGREALLEHNQMIDKEGLKPSTYRVSSHCRLGMIDVDFGFGKPILICPLGGFLYPGLRNFIFLMDHIDRTHTTNQDQVNGIIAWLTLDKKQMKNLSSTFIAHRNTVTCGKIMVLLSQVEK